MYRLWQTWHQGFARHAAILDDAVRTHLIATDIAALGKNSSLLYLRPLLAGNHRHVVRR